MPKILIAGVSNQNFVIVRYNVNGSLDTTFDYDGITSTINCGFFYWLCSIAIQNDGKILLAGTELSSAYTLVRFNSNGSIDSTFDNDGKVNTNIGNPTAYASSMILQNDGKILVSGSCQDAGLTGYCFARYNSNGSLDSTLDDDGKVITTIPSFYNPGGLIALQTDGKILMGGGFMMGFSLARYLSNGMLDSTFNFDGQVLTYISTSYVCSPGSISFQNNGKILFAGTIDSGLNSAFVLIRYNNNGDIDSTFGINGIIFTSIVAGPTKNEAMSVKIQSDDKILVAGYAGYSNNIIFDDFALVRYNNDGSLDSSFNFDGKVTTPIGIHEDRAYSMAIQQDGKIILAGLSYNGNSYDFAVTRYNVDSCSITTFSQALSICSNQSLNVGSHVYNVSGNYIDTLISLLTGCDSVVTTQLTVLPSNSISQSQSICAGQSITVGSNIYNVSGTYVDTLISMNNCDSVVTTTLFVIQNPIISTTLNGIQIIANQTGAIYQWIDCANSNIPIPGEVNQTFTPSINGSYAVIVNTGNCFDTSSCVNIQSIGINESTIIENEIDIIPNPFSMKTLIKFNRNINAGTINIYNVYGQIVNQINNINGTSISLNRDNFTTGIYLLQLIENNNIIASKKLSITD